MAVRRGVRYCARNEMKPRVLFFAVVLLGVFLLFVPAGRAHSPFDASARIILMGDSAEVAVTVGTSLGEQYLAIAQVQPGQVSGGRPYPLSAAMVTNFFEVNDKDGGALQLRAADVATDGLEYQFRFEYPLAMAKSLRVKANFLASLPAPRAAALVMTDDNGNILASAVLKEGQSTAEFPLAARMTGIAPAAGNGVSQGDSKTNQPLETAVAKAGETQVRPSFADFFKLGVEHILTGYDHLLFLLALLLGCRRVKTMLWVVTGFTLAHSLTLALAALEVVTISTRIVEPAIAASVFFVAAENFRLAEKTWQRYALTCGFGLIHGFGFAGALRETGLGGAGAEIVKPLLGFNLGVEAGQLVVAAVLLPLLLWLERQAWFERYGMRVVSGLVMAMALFWFWQRLR